MRLLTPFPTFSNAPARDFDSLRFDPRPPRGMEPVSLMLLTIYAQRCRLFTEGETWPSRSQDFLKTSLR